MHTMNYLYGAANNYQIQHFTISIAELFLLWIFESLDVVYLYLKFNALIACVYEYPYTYRQDTVHKFLYKDITNSVMQGRS